jgi:hypothetical protein
MATIDPTSRDRRTRLFRATRVSLIALVVGYFFLPYGVRAWIPAWLPFLAALALEAQFFLGGYLQARRGAPAVAQRDAGPQARDLAELGGTHWREAHAVDVAGERHLVPTEGLTDEEVHERVAAYAEDPAAAAEAEAAESIQNVEPDAPHRSLRLVVEAAAAVAVVAVIVVLASRPHGWDAVSPENRVRAEALFSREASRIAGHPATLRCDTSGRFVGFVQDADGLAFVGGTRAYLTPSICNTLYQLAFNDRVHSFSGTARAIAVLGHEAWHLRGVRDEGLANCYAFQSGVRTGVRLGLSRKTAHSMMREQLVANASDVGADARYVVPADCRNDGAHDLRPADDTFP